MPILATPPVVPDPVPDPITLPPWSNTVHWLGSILTASQQQPVLARLRSKGYIPADQKEWV